MAPRRILLDTAFLLHRAFHATARHADRMRDAHGRPDNALRGLVGTVERLRATPAGPPHAGAAPATVVLAAWDCAWRPTWRTALVPSYKAHRLATAGDGAERVDPRLAEQFPRAVAVLTGLGVPVMGAADCEADDVLATLAEQGPAWIVTGDRDLCQVVDDAAQVGLLLLGRTGDRWVDESAVQAMSGVQPASYVDFAVLRGDPSDGLAGAAGIGAVTAARLLAEFGTLEDLLAAAAAADPRLPARQALTLSHGAADLRAARAVVTLRRDAPLESLSAEGYTPEA